MASDPITWKNMRPVSIADELMAYAKYSGGAGDALRGVGTSIDDLLQRKSTRDTESFLAGADDLPTAEARNAALQQAREGFNLINVGISVLTHAGHKTLTPIFSACKSCLIDSL